MKTMIYCQTWYMYESPHVSSIYVYRKSGEAATTLWLFGSRPSASLYTYSVKAGQELCNQKLLLTVLKMFRFLQGKNFYSRQSV